MDLLDVIRVVGVMGRHAQFGLRAGASDPALGTSPTEGSPVAVSIFAVLLLLLIAALPAVIGITLLVGGRRSKGHPGCGACGYDVSETMGRSRTCPECGADLGTAGVSPGDRRHGRGRRIIGWLLVSVTAAAVLLYAAAFVAATLRSRATAAQAAAAARAQIQAQPQAPVPPQAPARVPETPAAQEQGQGPGGAEGTSSPAPEIDGTGVPEVPAAPSADVPAAPSASIIDPEVVDFESEMRRTTSVGRPA